VNDVGSSALPALAGYLAWLAAGCADFACHRRTDLAHTSGLRESTLHLVQLTLIGAAIGLGLLFAPSFALLLAMLVLVLVHAVVGYVDTRTAYGCREIRPIEQHVHSILDMAPWIALAWIALVTWDEAMGRGWTLSLRDPLPDAAIWSVILVPAALACGWPALAEWRRALAARREDPANAG
jgi:hypothetical protein